MTDDWTRLRKNDTIGNYRIERTADLAEINAIYHELLHLPTGARHIHIRNQDAENTFSIALKTVPQDSTGVAHILEHTTLCGSRKFPVRDPFFSMLKRSLNTFMNAFTASDWTMYPFSTQNRKDFYNLMDVYLDAVFFPLLDQLNFKQEGHRLELEDGRLVYKGVVYNEMKGAMSSPDQVMVRSLYNALYPDTTYSHNSGGDPEAIPQLAYDQLVAFHRRHYHPSNAFFYTYGDLDLPDHLAVIEDKVLRHFEKIDPDTEVPSQPRWTAPKTATYIYPLDPNEDPTRKNQVCLGWLTADIRNVFELIALSLLSEVLLGNPGSPLRKALMDSGLGSSLSDGTGFEGDLRDAMFTAGLKDVSLADADKIETIILAELEALSKNGIDREMIDAAIHQLEFQRKEITNTPYPYGIKLLLAISGSWFHGADVLKVLRIDDDLDRLRAEMDKGPFFENLIRRYFLDNPHRVRFHLVPDTEKATKEDARVTLELETLKQRLSESDLNKIEADAAALKALQDAPEDLSVLPTLAISDIPADVKVVPPSTPRGDVPAVWYEQPTSGIFYLTSVWGAGGLSPESTPLVPFFCYALTKLGTAERDYSEMARLIDLYTGGIGSAVHARTAYDEDGTCTPFINVSAKCLTRNVGRAFDLTGELLTGVNFRNPERLKTLLNEYRAMLESNVVRSGHTLAISLSARNFSKTRSLSETWQGVHQLKTIKGLAESVSPDALNHLADQLEAVAAALFSRDNLRLAFVGEDDALTAAVGAAAGLVDELSGTAGNGFFPPAHETTGAPPNEGWHTSTAVSFVARTFETVRMEHPDAPALAVIGKMLRSLYLHREIRERGGAYGGFSIYNPEDGVFAMGSYRDPHVVNTLKVYDHAGEFIRSGDYADDDVKEAILQVCADIDKPDPPGPAARKAFYRSLLGLSDEARRQFKRRLLTVTRDMVRQTADRYFVPDPSKEGTAVISNENALTAANAEMPDRPLSLNRI